MVGARHTISSDIESIKYIDIIPTDIKLNTSWTEQVS